MLNTISEFWRATFSEPIAAFTFFLVLATGGLWASTALLWLSTTRLAKDTKESGVVQADKMERSITAAIDQAKIMEDAAKRELRAYVCLQQVTMDEIVLGGAFPKIVFPLENTGLTPANCLIIHWGWKVTAEEPTSEFFISFLDQYPILEQQDNSIGPRHVKNKMEDVTIGEEWKDKVLSGKEKLYILGRIHYKDAFDISRITEFFYSYTTKLPNHLGQVRVHNRIE